MTVKRIQRFDRVGAIHCDPARTDGVLAVPDEVTGFLRLDARITRVGVFRYRDAQGNEWGELRTEAEVFHPDSVESFKSVVATNDHPAEFVTRANVRAVQAGHLGSDIRRDGPFLRTSIVITDPVTILDIQEGKCELSCGYYAELIDAPGSQDGERYDLVQTNIRGNHVAVVDVGRAGPECCLLSRPDGAAIISTPILRGLSFDRADDEEPSTTGGAPTMKASLKKLAAVLLRSTDDKKANKALATEALAIVKSAKADQEGEGANMFDKILGLLMKAQESGDADVMDAVLAKVAGMLGAGPEAPPAEAPAPEPEMTEESPELDEDLEEEDAAAPSPTGDSVAAMRAELDALKAERKREQAARKADKASEAQRIDARVELVATARAIVPGIQTTGKTDAELMRAVVLAVQPDAQADLDANRNDKGYLKARFDVAVKLESERNMHSDEALGAIFDAHNGQADGDLEQIRTDFHKRRDERSRNVRRQTAASSN